MQLNQQVQYDVSTHEGGTAASHLKPIEQLRRSVMSCFLWESEFYESGNEIAERIKNIVPLCNQLDAGKLAVELRNKHNLRHVPLLVAACMNPHSAKTIYDVIQRPDELAEIIAMFWELKGSRKASLTPAMKRGIARAFGKFSEYQIAKYNRDHAIKLRDVVFLTHPKPSKAIQSLIDGTLKTPDTWEVALSSGADKRKTFTRLIHEGKLGYLALLRNLRNMSQSGVDPDCVGKAIRARIGAQRVLPFRYVAAVRAAPMFATDLDIALRETVAELPQFEGTTAILVDVSGSMEAQLSSKSDISRMDTAATLASIFPGSARIFTFSSKIVEVPQYPGLSGIDTIVNSQSHMSTKLGNALCTINETIKHDRLIVITDEQTCDEIPNPVCKYPYMINVASAKNGVGYGKWVHIDGFSESVLKFIAEYEYCK